MLAGWHKYCSVKFFENFLFAKERFFGAENGETALYFELNYARVVQLHSSVRQALKYKALLFYV